MAILGSAPKSRDGAIYEREVVKPGGANFVERGSRTSPFPGRVSQDDLLGQGLDQLHKPEITGGRLDDDLERAPFSGEGRSHAERGNEGFPGREALGFEIGRLHPSGSFDRGGVRWGGGEVRIGDSNRGPRHHEERPRRHFDYIVLPHSLPE
jgi:hypothetical protein